MQLFPLPVASGWASVVHSMVRALQQAELHLPRTPSPPALNTGVAVLAEGLAGGCEKVVGRRARYKPRRCPPPTAPA